MPTRKIVPDVIKEPRVIALDKRESVRNAVALMTAHNISALFVLDNRVFYGIFTERDVSLHVVHAGLNPNTTSLEEVSTIHPITVSPETSVLEALEVMETNRVRHLPVVNLDNTLVGMLSIRDLFIIVNDHLKQELHAREEFIFGSGYSS